MLSSLILTFGSLLLGEMNLYYCFITKHSLVRSLHTFLLSRLMFSSSKINPVFILTPLVFIYIYLQIYRNQIAIHALLTNILKRRRWIGAISPHQSAADHTIFNWVSTVGITHQSSKCLKAKGCVK